MRRFLPLLLLLSCSSPSQEELTQRALAAASREAEMAYTDLLSSHYEAFLDRKAGADTLKPDYRSQLLDACRQTMAAQQHAHKGIAGFHVSDARMDSASHLAQVFILIEYGDSTQEEVLVPMVEHHGRWMMK